MPFKNVDERRKHFRNRYNSLRQAWISKNGPCKICGSKLNLEVDHVDPTKKSHPKDHTRLWNWDFVRRDIELAKCQVLCKSCHCKKSLEERIGRDRIAAGIPRGTKRS